MLANGGEWMEAKLTKSNVGVNIRFIPCRHCTRVTKVSYFDVSPNTGLGSNSLTNITLQLIIKTNKAARIFER